MSLPVKHKMQRSKIFFLYLVGAVFFLTGCGPSKPPTSKSRPKPAIRAQQSQETAQEAEALFKTLGEKNPFRPDHAVRYVAASPISGHALKGIVWDGQKPFAIIGEQVVREGDRVGPQKVIKIEQDAVTLEAGGQREILRLE